MNPDAQMIDAIVLAGGRGTRLSSVVSDVPKPLAPVGGRPFIDYQLSLLARTKRIETTVLALGHLADKVVDHYAASPAPLPLTFEIEKDLLGTGGGLRNAVSRTTRPLILALNGDSVFRWRLEPLFEALKKTGCDCAMALVEVEDTSRYGSVLLEGDQVVAFHEKTASTGPGLVNAGLYLFSRDVIEALPVNQVISLESEIFPRLAAQGRLAAAVYRSPFIDIGLPETYAAAAGILSDIDSEA